MITVVTCLFLGNLKRHISFRAKNTHSIFTNSSLLTFRLQTGYKQEKSQSLFRENI